MAHITVVGASAPSHILPTVGLVRELAHRGHRVTYAVGAHLAPLVAGAGAEPVPCTSLLPRDGAAWPEEPIAAMTLFLDEGIHVLPQLAAALDATPPDLVLHDIGGLGGPGRRRPLGRPRRPALPRRGRVGGLRGGHGRADRGDEGRARRRRVLRPLRRLARRARRRPRRPTTSSAAPSTASC